MDYLGGSKITTSPKEQRISSKESGCAEGEARPRAGGPHARSLALPMRGAAAATHRKELNSANSPNGHGGGLPG